MQVKIRKARKADIRGIMPIWIREYGKEPYREMWTKRKAATKLGEYLERDLFYVATVNGEIAGFIIASEEYWHDGYHGKVEEIVVSGKFQGKGIGKALMEHVETVFRKRGFVEMSLIASPRAGAFRFYKGLGYRKARYVIMDKKL